jgi:hypothetical protein
MSDRRLPVRPDLEQLEHQAKDLLHAIRDGERLHPGYGPDSMHEYRDVTPLSWGERFHSKVFVSAPAMRLIADKGGHA